MPPATLVRGSLTFLFGGARYTPSFVALLALLFSIITNRVNLVTPAIVLMLVGVVTERRPAPLPGFVIGLWLFIAWAYAGSFASLDAQRSSEALEVLFKTGIIVFATSRLLSDGARVRVTAVAVVMSFMVYPVRGGLMAYFHGHRLFGRAIWQYQYDNPNALAAFLFLPLGLAVWLAKSAPYRALRLGLYGCCGLMALLILLTQSRGALIGLVLAVGGYVLSGTGKVKVRKMAGLLAVVACLVPFVPSSAWQRFAGMRKLTSTDTAAEADPEGSAGGRLAIWRIAITITGDYPAMGVGIGAYPVANWAYAKRMRLHPASFGYRDTHSTYLNVSAETGIPGILLFLVVVAAAVVPTERARKSSSDPAVREFLLLTELSLAAFLVSALWGSFSRSNLLYLHLALLCAASALIPRPHARAIGRGARASAS